MDIDDLIFEITDIMNNPNMTETQKLEVIDQVIDDFQLSREE